MNFYVWGDARGRMNKIEQGTNIDEKIISLKDLKETGHEVKNCPSASLIDLSDGVFCCEFHTKMNALNSELIDFIHTALAYVAVNGVGMVFGNEACGTRALFPPALIWWKSQRW